MNNFHPTPPGFNQFTESVKEPRFKVSCSDYMRLNTINAHRISMKARIDAYIDMLAIYIKNCNKSVFKINPLRDEYEDEDGCEDDGTIYNYSDSRAICITTYNKDLDVALVFIFTTDGEAHLFTNDSFYGYHIMVDLIFGGEDVFKSCCDIIDKGVTNDQMELVPFMNLIDSI